MEFKTYIDRLEKPIKDFFSATGDGTEDVYELIREKDTGEEILKKTGKHNVYADIQAYAPSADISNIIQRFQNGEIDVLTQSKGAYFDATSLPKSYAEYFAKVKEAEKLFSQLPDEVRNKFDNDAEKFFLEFGTDAFVEKVKEPEVIDKANEVKEGYDNAE